MLIPSGALTAKAKSIAVPVQAMTLPAFAAPARASPHTLAPVMMKLSAPAQDGTAGKEDGNRTHRPADEGERAKIEQASDGCRNPTEHQGALRPLAVAGPPRPYPRQQRRAKLATGYEPDQRKARSRDRCAHAGAASAAPARY